MASKLQSVTEFSRKKTQELSAVRGNWQQYLKTAARIYKYPFRDQLLIHAQRPDATACATIEFWNKRMDRWVNRGATGIALLDDSGPKTRLKYVFDVSDTHPGRYHPQDPQLWQMQSAYEETVLESISNSFEAERQNTEDFAEQIRSMCHVIAEDNLPDYLEELRNNRNDSFLEELDELNLAVRIKTLLTNSVAYTVLTRCGYDADLYFDEMDFEFIHDFSTYETMSILGNASNSISKMILLEIGRTIQQQERAAKFAKPQNDVYDRGTKEPPLEARKETEHYDQRTELHPDQGLSVSQSVSAGDRGGYPDGQVRDAAQDVPEEAQANAVRPVVAGRQAGRISDGHRSTSHRNGGSADAAAGTAERSGRGDEGQQPDGMGAGHEQLQGIGRGSGTPTVGLQLNESEQVHISPPEAENVSSTSSAFFVGQQDVDQFLRYGGNTDHLRMRVVSLFQIEMPLPMIAERLQMLYHGGNGITMEQGHIAAWYNADGIHLALGDRTRYVTTAQIIPWESAAQRVGQLLEAGQFASNVELLEAEGYERQPLSQSLLNLYHDIDMQNGIADSLHSLSQDFRNQNFPEEERRLDTCLANPDFRDSVIQSYNYGGGFLDYVAARGGKYSFELAQAFAEQKSGGVKVTYKNEISIAENGGWRYNYGNMFYVRLVKQYFGGLSSDLQQRIAAIAQDYQNYGITAPAGYCEMWEEQVYRAVGVQVNNWCCAGRNRITNVVSTDSSNIPVGAMVYNDPVVYNSHTTCSCGMNAGHVGIYIGNGMIISNIGGSSTDTLESWTSYYGFGGWGWGGAAVN